MQVFTFLCLFSVDLPGIVSGANVAFLDPHEIYFGRGESGRQFDIKHRLLQTQLYDQFSPFHDIFGCDLSNAKFYNGTLFRFPLRNTPESQLSKTVYNESMIDSLFESLRQEASIILLFLKSVQKISIFKRTDNGSVNCIFRVELSHETSHQVTIQRQRLLSVAAQTSSVQESKVIIGINTSSNGTVKCRKWLVVNQIGSCNKRITQLRAKLCLLPWIGLAVPIDEESSLITDGRIFCFLPLPPDVDCRTGMPVHIHGYFGLTDNRRGLTWPGMECQNNETAEWNKLLLSEIASTVYCKILEVLVTNQPNTGLSDVERSRRVYSTMPVFQNIQGHWKCILNPLLQQMMNQSVFYAMRNTGNCWIALSYGILDLLQTMSETRKVILKVVSQRHAVITDLPPHVLELIRKVNFSPKVISPAIVRSVLREQEISANITAREEKLNLLSYILSDGNTADITGIPLLPLANKNFITFCKHKHSSNPKASILVPSGNCTADLLPNMSSRFIDESLQEDVKGKLFSIAATKPNAKYPTQLVRLNSQIVIQNIRSCLPSNWFKCSNDRVLWKPGTSDHPPQRWLEATWSWINTSFSTSLAQFEGIPLLPIGNHLGVLSRNSKFIFGSEGVCTNLPSQLCDLLTACGCTVLASLPSYIQSHREINTYVASPTPSGVLCVLRQISIKVLAAHAANKLTTEDRAVFVRFMSGLSSTISKSDKDLLLQLPLFQTLHGTVTSAKNLKAVSTDHNLPTDFQLLKERIVILSTDSYVCRLLSLLGIQFLSSADMLMQYVFPDISANRYNNQNITVLIRWILERITIFQYQSQGFFNAVKGLPFVSTQSGIRKRPTELYDPTDRILQNILSGEKDVFPTGFYATSDIISKLKQLGIKTRETLAASDILSFAQMIASSAQPSALIATKVSALLTILNDNPSYLNNFSSYRSLREDLSNLRWIPCATKPPSNYPNFVQWYKTPALLLPSESRSSSKALLIGSSMPTIDLNANSQLQQAFGLTLDPPLHHVISQLQTCIECWRAHKNRSLSGLEVAKFQEMLVQIYSHLSKLQPREISNALAKKSLADWIWHGKGFCQPSSVALSTDFKIDLRPQLFLLAKEFCSNQQLIKFFLQHGVRKKFSDEDILGVLDSIRRKHANHNTPHSVVEVTQDLAICRDILQWVVKDGNVLPNHLQEKVFVPVQSRNNVLVLAACKKCTYCDREWLRKGGSELDIPGDYQVIHDSVSAEVARRLGVPALSTCLLSAETLGFEQTGPYESITNRIKSVLQEYTEGGIFKELIQNADDACATVVRFVVDWRSGPTETLLSADMAESQGPALWAYNNEEFSDHDFENINKLAGATKVEELGKIGRFGLGFNAVYHLTDVPSFVSRKYFVLFDPNVNHIENHIPDKSRPGIRIDLSSNPRPLSAFEDQFQPYHGIFGCSTQITDGIKFNFSGTLFRFPFRTTHEAKKSDICQSVYDEVKVRQIIISLRECSSLLLLFTQHVTKVELYEIDSRSDPKDMRLLLSVSKQGSKIKRSSDPALSKQPFIKECSNWWRHELGGSSFTQQITPSRCEVFEVVTKEMQSNLIQSQSKSETRETWLVASCGGTGTSVSLASGEGRSRGLLPCGGAAARLNSVSSDESNTKLDIDAIDGEAFCFLPLSIPTGLPVHVNGYFAVTSNRRGIWERTTSSQYQVIEVRWNEALFSDALCNAYLELLNDVKDPPVRDCSSYALWPVHVKLHSANWGKLVESVYEKIVSNSLPLFYSDGKWLSIKEGYILDDELRHVPEFRNTLKMLKKDVFDIPLNVLSSMNKAGQKKAVLKSTLNLETFLKKLFLPNIGTISSNIRDPIICYVLDCILSGRSEFAELLNAYQCITCSEDGKHLAKPSSLINPKGPVACLFSSDDHRFPFGNCFLKDNRMYALERLGMVNERISWTEICDRAKSVAVINQKKGLERTRNLIKYLKENIEKLPKPDSSSISDLRRTEFLPFTSTCPNGYELPWHGSKFNKQQLFAPNDVFLSSEKYLVGSSCVIVDDSDETGCGKLGHQVKDLLGFLNRFPTVRDVIGQLDAAISVKSVCSEKRKSLESVCKRVYKFLDNFLTRVFPDVSNVHSQSRSLDTSDGKLLLKELNQRSWLFIHGHFVPTRKAAFNWDGSGAPYLYSVPFDYSQNYSKLLNLAGVRQTFSHMDFIDALKSLQEAKAGRPLNDNEIKLAVCFATALKDVHHEIESSQIGKIPLPDCNNVLCMSGELTINLTFWLKDRGDARYVHKDVPSQLALDMGAQSLQNRRLKKYSSAIATPFGQHEKLTDRLKNILKSYPCDSGILKELVQNADDAGASEIHFIYDTRKLPHEKVLQNHAEEVQGPALCVFNDKPFTAEDLEGIQKLGIGSKTDDPEKTGQYGIGFNAVYHLTDCPSFLSNEDTLCFLDPHCRYAPEATLDSPGERFEQIDDEFREDFKDVLVGYLGEYFNLKEATMFRLPLRTFERSRNSLISQHYFGNYNFKALLQRFEAESKKMLLFLNHVKKISISEMNKDGQLKPSYSVFSKLEVEYEEKRRELSGIIKRSKHLPTSDVEWCGITYPLTTSDSNNVVETWIVHQCCGTPQQTAKDSIPDGRQYGLFPRGGIAALATPQRSPSEHKPQHVAYCFLPLPVETGLPVHVNGHFALDSSRRNLWHDTDPNSPLTKWNNFIKTSVLAPGYATLILESRQYIPFSQEMVKHDCRGLFRNNLDVRHGLFWYHQLFPTPSKDSPWNILAREVYHYMGTNNLQVLPVVVADDRSVEETNPQRNQDESSNDVIHRIRFWLSSRDAYFIEGKGQLKLDEDRLFKLLLRVNLPLLLYSPTVVYFHFLSAEVTCNSLTPLNVIRFMRSFSDSNSNCQVGNLPINLMKSNIRDIAELKVLIQYCQMEEQFPECLEGLPILLTADGQLRVFDSSKPVYRSKFSDLFPQDGNLFVHPDLVYSLPDIDKLPENRVMQQFTVNSLNQHFPRVFPEHMRGTSEHVSWDFPQNGPLSRRWFQRVWDFLQNHTTPNLNNNEMPLSVLGDWLIIPTTSDKLVTINNGKTVLDATRRSTDSAQGKRIRDILEKLDCPILNTEITVKKPKVQTPGFFASTVGKFLPLFGTGLEAAPADNNSHVTDSHVAQPHNVPDVLQVLDFVRRTGSLDTSRLSTDELSTVLSFVQDDIDNLTTQHAIILKHLPIYMGIDGAYFSLTDYASSAVIPHGVPTSEMANLQYHTGCLFLNTTSATILHHLYKWLGVGVELSFPEFYCKYIIPRFEIFNRDSQILYLTHIKDDVLPSLQADGSKQITFVEFLTGSLCIPDEEGHLHYAREFHDPRNEVFQIMLEDNSDHFPPASFRSFEWLEFLSEIGMKTKVQENQFLEFCEEVALCSNLDPTTSIEKSKTLVNYLFINEHLRSEKFLCSLSSISFIAPEKVELSLLSLHKQFKCNTIDDEPPFVQFFDAVPWKYHVLTWTSAALLPSWVQLDEKLQRYLGVQEVPSVESIVSHLQNLSCALAEICRRDEVLPQSILLKKIMTSIYEGLSKELSCSDSKDISDSCSLECKSIGKRLSSIPCVLVEEGVVMVPGDRLSFARQFDSTFIPFLYTVPRKYCAYEHLMKRLGATEQFTSMHFAVVLKSIREKCRNTKMNPNLFEKAKAAMAFLFQSLLVESQGGNETKISDLTELFLPSDKEILVESSDLILKIAPRYKSALANRANLNVLLPLEKCNLHREKENDYLNALPQHLRPKLMESLFKEVLDPNCLNERCSLCQEDDICDFIKRYILVIKSPEFHSAIIRLLKHKKNSTELTEDEEGQLSVFNTNKLEIICMRSIKVHLIDTETKEPLVNCSIGRQCYVVEDNSSWKLYIRHNTEEAWLIYLSYCINRIARRVFDDSSLQVISSMLLCKSPSQIPGILDQLNIAEDFSEEEFKIGVEVPIVYHYLLQQNPLFIFHEGEIVAYGIETESSGMAEEIEDGFADMKYVLAKVISRTNESDGPYDFTAEYLIDLGNERKKVSVVDLYKFVQDDVGENQTYDLVPFTGDPTSLPSSLDEAKQEIREAILKAWRLPAMLRRKVIRRLYLRWHPDKNPDNFQFAGEMFRFLLSEIKRMEAEESGIDDSCGFSTLFTGWSRRARREKETYVNFRGSSGGPCPRSTSDYTYPDVSESRRWLRQARRDLEAAQLLNSSSQSFDALVCFLSHQVVEKSLKGALYAKCGLTNDQLHTHDVYSLANNVCRLRGSPDEITDMAIVVGNYYLTTRYPNQQPGAIVPADAFSTNQSEKALESAQGLLEAVETFAFE